MHTRSHYRPKHVLGLVRKWSKSLHWPNLRLKINCMHDGHHVTTTTHASRQNLVLLELWTLKLRSIIGMHIAIVRCIHVKLTILLHKKY